MTAPSPSELLASLISIPSVNPEDTSDPAITGEQRVAEFLAEELRARGFSTTLDPVHEGRPNVIGEAGDPAANRTFLIEVHTDTVSVAGMTIPPFDAPLRDGRIWGRGACDNKGPMAASLCALTPERVSRLTKAGWRIVYVGAMGEEKGNVGARHLVQQGGIRANEGLILEPTDLNIVTSHKGVMWFTIHLDGLAGHGSDPDRAVNAIDGAVATIQLVRDQKERAATQHSSWLGSPTLSVGRISGGSQVNIVPDRCSVQFDRRLLPGETAAEILAELEDRLHDLRQQGIICNFAIEPHEQGNPFETSKECALVSRLKASLQDTGLPLSCVGASWFSDAGPLAAICDELIVFGPGSIRQAHTADEFIEQSELEKGVKVLEHFFDRLASESER